jgi:hypothetical protein
MSEMSVIASVTLMSVVSMMALITLKSAIALIGTGTVMSLISDALAGLENHDVGVSMMGLGNCEAYDGLDDGYARCP